MKLLADLFLNQLADMYDTEQRLVKAMPKISRNATCEQVRKLLHSHLEETKGHVAKLEQLFDAMGKSPRAQRCEATIGLLEECNDLVAQFKGSPIINAALICGAQKIEHYEIATYGCLYQWAGLLENDDAADVIAEIQAEEKAADEALTLLSVLKNQEGMEDAGVLDLDRADQITTLITRVIYTSPTQKPPGWSGTRKNGS